MPPVSCEIYLSSTWFEIYTLVNADGGSKFPKTDTKLYAQIYIVYKLPL